MMETALEPRTLPYDKVAELIEARTAAAANAYIENGYTLLAVMPAAWLDRRESGDFLRKGVTFVLGRGTDIEPWSP